MRIGLIGAGANTRQRHIPGFRAVEGVEIVTVCNRSLESSRRVAQEFGIPVVMPTVEELIADPDIDAICIGTWPYAHREYTLLALQAGKHVLCEARMAMDATEAQEMLEASEEHPHLVAQLVPAPFDFRLGPTVARMLREGVVGDVYEVFVTVLNSGGLDRSAPLHWRHQARFSGHNMMALGIYNEIVQRWLGDTVRVVADGAVFVGERTDPATGQPARVDVPDSLTVSAQLANGGRATYLLSGMVGANGGGSIVIHGSKASLIWAPQQPGNRTEHAVLHELGGTATTIEPDPGTDRGWQVEADFAASVRSGAPVRLTNFSDGVKYMRFTDAVWHSWQEGRAVVVSPRSG